MRIISSDGKYDFPYETSTLAIFQDREKGYGIYVVISEHAIYQAASFHYETEAIKELERLRIACTNGDSLFQFGRGE